MISKAEAERRCAERKTLNVLVRKGGAGSETWVWAFDPNDVVHNTCKRRKMNYAVGLIALLVAVSVRERNRDNKDMVAISNGVMSALVAATITGSVRNALSS